MSFIFLYSLLALKRAVFKPDSRDFQSLKNPLKYVLISHFSHLFFLNSVEIESWTKVPHRFSSSDNLYVGPVRECWKKTWNLYYFHYSTQYYKNLFGLRVWRFFEESLDADLLQLWSRKAVSAYLSGKQILSLGSTWQSECVPVTGHRHPSNTRCI